MARQIVKLPDVGEGTTEAEIVAWHVKPGDMVEEDDPLVEVMTDKATVELPAPVNGRIVAIHGDVGDKRPVGSALVELEVEGAEEADAGPRPPVAEATGPSRSRNAGEGSTSPALARIAGEGADPGTSRGSAGEGKGIRPLASPAVRKRAADRGLALDQVPGTGEDGRITQADFDAYISAKAPAPSDTEVEAIPIVGLRRAIAAHLSESHRRIPHFSYVEEVEVGAAESLRAQLNADHPDRPHLTLLPFLMRAIVKAIAAHPQVNARFDDEAGILNRFRAVHLGVATQTENGLVVPVVRHAERLDLWQAAAEIARLADSARAGKATREELGGSTITISSLGPLGGIAATPVINLPEVAIVGVNKIVARPIVRDGQVAVAQMMNLSSSFDHRIVDGWTAASFIQRVKSYLEQPATMFID
ncbi:MAG TPA: dihydrolipoamide acetyltransferase family protein [Stellaceae bacterium]|jgi:2-oxoisovalerate dehydrogenase E2 component (dihydrolipoyl transacylase)|nr:dihydrolipoamide acetyltransferase family protein [Stellaceae bacterium]